MPRILERTAEYEVHDIDFRLIAVGAPAILATEQNGRFAARSYRYLSLLSPYPINPENGHGPFGRCRLEFDSGRIAVQGEIVNYRLPPTKCVRFFNLQDAFDNRRPRGGSGPGRIILSTDPLPYVSRKLNLLISLDLSIPANPGPGPLVTLFPLAWGYETATALSWLQYLTGYAPHKEVRVWYSSPGAGNVLTAGWNAAWPGAAPTPLVLTAQIPYQQAANNVINPLYQASGCGYFLGTNTAAGVAPAVTVRVWFMFIE